MPLRALLLDVDGTLVDSSYVHVEAWWQAFDERGMTIPRAWIHRRIGMDGGRLVEELLDAAESLGRGPDDRKSETRRVKDLHDRHLTDTADRMRLLPGARELIRTGQELGLRVLLATSAPQGEFARLRALLDVDEHLYAVTTGEDVDTAKPEPDIVGVALERAGVEAGEALMVGDATWDAAAATKLGVRCAGVETGGIGGAVLREAGYALVVDDAAALEARLSGIVQDWDDRPAG